MHKNSQAIGGWKSASLLILSIQIGLLSGATYHVDRQAPNASDTNAGAALAPWKTISRAGQAAELKPGDQVLIHSGIYREHVQIKVSGAPDKPITFAAAPDSRVIIKGSELVRGRWTKLKSGPELTEPYPNAFTDVWKITLGEEFFVDPRFEGVYREKSKRWLSQVYIQDDKPLQRIGPDPIYRNANYLQLATVGRGLTDLIHDSFFFDAAHQTLYIRIAGDPLWYSIEAGVRGFALTAEKAHDLVIRGLEMRHNRQPGGQWPMVSVNGCARILIEDCRILQSDFCGLGLGRCTNCVVRNCSLSNNGNTGLGMGECEGCTVESCALLFNNYRRFHNGWHNGGMKCIPRNRRCIVRHCEAAYNIEAPGIWFDSENSDIQILGNVSHHNGAAGIFFEINKGGGIIADNLVYANRDRGIYISGSQNTWVVNNTVAGNQGGIICMPRGPDWPLENVHVLNNLFLQNTTTAETGSRGCELTMYMGCRGNSYVRTVIANHSDFNVYATNSEIPMLRHDWNPNNTLGQWRERFGEDQNSRPMRVPFELRGTGFKLFTRTGLDIATNLPAESGWKPAAKGQVGASLTQWP